MPELYVTHESQPLTTLKIMVAPRFTFKNGVELKYATSIGVCAAVPYGKGSFPSWYWKRVVPEQIPSQIISVKKREYIYASRARVLDPISEAFHRERDAFFRIKAILSRDEKYAGKFVAIYKGEVIDFCDDKSSLAERVYEKHGYVPIYISKLEKKKKPREIPSPERWI